MIEFADIYFDVIYRFRSCSLLTFEISVPPNSPPVTSRPYRVNLLMVKVMDTILDEYLAAGLVQHQHSRSTHPASTTSSTSWAEDGYFPSLIYLFVAPDNGSQRHDPTHGILHAHAPLRVAGHPTRKQRGAGWFVKVINEVTKGLANVAAYLDDVIVFDPDPSVHILNLSLIHI